MAIPPFNDLRLKKGEWPKQERLEELLEGYARNFEDLYNRAQTVEASNEALARYIQSVSAEKLRVVRGIVDTTAPSIVKGKGFTVTKPSAGRAAITFTPSFSDTPSIACTSATASNISTFLSEAATKEKAATVNINTAFAAADGVFHFIAIGPR